MPLKHGLTGPDTSARTRGGPAAGFATATAPTGTPRTARGTQACTPEQAGSFADAIRREPWLTKIARRAITVPGLVIATALWVVAGIAILPIGAAIDVVRGRPQFIARFWAILAVVLVGQLLGMLTLYAAWVLCGFGMASQTFASWNQFVMSGWSHLNVRALAWIYDMSYEIEGAHLAQHGPTLLLSRHSSIIDTIVPIAVLGWGQKVGFRIVLKHELLYSPPVDSIGHCRPVAFVRRGSGSLPQELQSIRKLATGLAPGETVLFFPEGTRFTPAKQAHIVAKLTTKHPEAAAAAAALRHVLPFRPAGTHALIDAAPHADLLFCAHTGFEDSAQLEDFLRGGLYRKQIKIKYWRVAASSVPTEHAAREAVLNQHWRAMDQWVEDQLSRAKSGTSNRQDAFANSPDDTVPPA